MFKDMPQKNNALPPSFHGEVGVSYDLCQTSFYTKNLHEQILLPTQA